MIEHLGCKVLHSADKKLFLLDGFLKKRFGPPKPPPGKKFGGTCLLSNVIAVEAAISGLSERALFNEVMPHLPNCDISGHTLDQILGALDKVAYAMDIKLDPMSTFTRCAIHRYCHRLHWKKAIQHVLSGRPVIAIVGHQMTKRFDLEANFHNDGIVATPIVGKNMRIVDAGYHSYVWFGIDDDGYAILRDSRHVYGFKGYLKVHGDVFFDAVRVSKGALLGYFVEAHIGDASWYDRFNAAAQEKLAELLRQLDTEVETSVE